MVTIVPDGLDALRGSLHRQGVTSFWGHDNTLEAAGTLLGMDIRPATPRPALCLTKDGYPTLNGLVFKECWVLSPDYHPGYRPAASEEIPAHAITGWQVLRIDWPTNKEAMQA